MDFITLLSGDWEALLFSFDGESGAAHSRAPGRFLGNRCPPSPLTEEGQKRAGHDRGRQGHEHEHAKEALREDVKFIAKIKRDEFHQAAGIHQRTELERFPPWDADQTGGEGAAAKFADGGECDDDAADQPVGRAIQQSDFSSQAGERKKYREKKYRTKTFDPHSQFTPKATMPRHDKTGDKRSEKCPDAEQLSAER